MIDSYGFRLDGFYRTMLRIVFTNYVLLIIFYSLMNFIFLMDLIGKKSVDFHELSIETAVFTIITSHCNFMLVFVNKFIHSFIQQYLT